MIFLSFMSGAIEQKRREINFIFLFSQKLLYKLNKKKTQIFL